MMNDGRVVAALNVGNSMVRVLIGEMRDDGTISYPGWFSCASSGIRDGVVVNIEKARNCIQLAVDKAEMKAFRTVQELWISIGGTSVESHYSQGIATSPRKREEIKQADIDRAIEQAAVISLPSDRDTIHILPFNYTVDHQRGIRNPLNMLGQRLEAEVLLVTATTAMVCNVKEAVERADYRVGKMTHGILASSASVLKQEEKERGVLLIDIGASGTDFMTVYKGFATAMGSVPVGGYLATADLSKILGISVSTAEKLKREWAGCWLNGEETGECVLVPGSGGQGHVSVPIDSLAKFLEPRMAEMFDLIRKQLGRQQYGNGAIEFLVLTGGGSLLNGAVELAGEIFDLPARRGKPKPSLNLPSECCEPDWSVAAGMIQMAAAEANCNREVSASFGDARRTFLSRLKNGFGQFF